MCAVYWLNKQCKNTQIDNAKYLDVVMLMYNLIEYSNNYLKTSRAEFESFKFKIRITRNTPDDDNTKKQVFVELLNVIN